MKLAARAGTMPPHERSQPQCKTPAAAGDFGHRGLGAQFRRPRLMAQLHDVAPHVEVEFLDALTLSTRLFRAYYAGGFALGMTRLPRLYGLGFAVSDRPQTPAHGLNGACGWPWSAVRWAGWRSICWPTPPTRFSTRTS